MYPFFMSARPNPQFAICNPQSRRFGCGRRSRCGHQSHFFENTVRELRAMSKNKRVSLVDSEPDEHVIVFEGGRLVGIICPKTKDSGSVGTRDTAPGKGA